ncbi:D-2-hydroxyacid dehydrogenase [Steroidobacter agaridevorans]|uniref:D-2-hydroxyacid dehydrogenase n=1 Tax=Steroidobacter agaridevorans TaxID=2695856 RepID=A0A829Y918_9GAMM|nr:FAD-binding oxidoreductase [Steroidobacter agaridevorans]GFE79358.1 D-2-hydroxyacid dehydrogenase [Steroidobacter agaridevorans]GFE88363.1 D-2-hydroxyacid dehydrogenase [Steroidobacter agaridevorans]
MSITRSLLADLRRAVGPQGYLEQAADIEPFLVDHRKLYRGATPLVLRPESTDQVSAIMRMCNEARVGVVPVGGNTGYCGGATPSEDGSQIVLSLARMRRIRAIDPLNYTMIAEAGCVLAEVQAAAASVDRLFPMSLGSEGSCQLGGNLSTNAGGTAVLRYGMMRDLILGLEVVLPDGRVLDNLKPLRKDNTGYDLRNLFIGAEGTLGVITAAACKLFSRPASNVTAFVGLTDPQRAVSLLSRLRTFTGDAVSTFELIPRTALELVLEYIPNTANPLDQGHDWYVLLEIGMGRQAESMREAIEAELAAAMEQGEISDAALAASESQREMFWRLRETIPEAQRHIGASIKHDVSVTTSELPRFIVEASQLVRALSPKGRIVSYGHLGDGNLHFNISRPIDSDDESFLRLAPNINRAVHDLIARYGGSISAEHGIGRLKREELVRYEPPVAIEVMRAIKQALDPNGIMNPGKVL